MPIKKTDLPWLLELTTLAAVVTGLTFAAIELRQLRAAQEAQTVLQLFETMKSEEYVAATNIIQSIPYGLTAAELRERISEEELRMVTQLLLTYEALGVMVYRRDVSIAWVNELFRQLILQTWEKLGPLVIDNREILGYPGYYEWVQWLAERLRGVEKDQLVPAYEAFKDWEP